MFTDSDAFAGTERHILDLGRGLRQAGADVRIVSPGGSPLAVCATELEIPTMAVEKQGFVDWTAISILRRSLCAGEINLIHAHNGRTGLAAALAVKLEGRGCYVLTQHFLEPYRASRKGPQALLSHAAHRWITRSAGRVIAISEAVRRGMEERRECANGNVVVIPNGIFAPDPEKLQGSAEVRRRFGIEGDAPLIVCAARLEPEKDLGTLIRAMETVCGAEPRARCVLAGDGSQKPQLAAQALASGLDKNVVFAGFLPDALSLIRAGDLFVLPSVAEPFGLVLLEAMALGKPVVATSSGGPVEIVQDDCTGRLIPPSDSEALASSILELLANPETLEEMGRRGRTRFAEKFTCKRMVCAMLEAYTSALTA